MKKKKKGGKKKWEREINNNTIGNIYIYMCVDLSYPDLCTHQYNSARNGSS
ncbi:Uncharacterized protein APZ42_034006 [Daphnia magna]|uniref:Uncharacterized protein n=1 Tax=Daphnia magna TaxID=35525 RepID=A0A164KJX6_9CRUS|nr:Uncharacterized protein APZ42_034006 [Daphnia magna]